MDGNSATFDPADTDRREQEGKGNGHLDLQMFLVVPRVGIQHHFETYPNYQNMPKIGTKIYVNVAYLCDLLKFTTLLNSIPDMEASIDKG